MIWFGDDLKLPQNDPSVERTEALAEARSKYVYDDHKLNLDGLAMSYENPEKVKLGWVATLLRLMVDIGVNSARVHKVEEQISGTHTSHIKRGSRIEGARNPVAHAFGELNDLVMEGDWAKEDERPTSIDDYDRLFQQFELPAFARGKGMDRPCFGDKWFSEYRLNGSNAAWIKRTTGALPDDYAKMEAFGALSKDPGAFGDALAAGKVYVADYSLLLEVDPKAGGFKTPKKPFVEASETIELPNLELREKDPQAWRSQRETWIEKVYKPWKEQYDERDAKGYAGCDFGKTLTAPVGVFEMSEDGTALEPVGIQVAPALGGAAPRIYTPKDGWAWRQAKAHLQMADGNVHQAISHLAETHMVMEAALLSMHNCLAPHHPLNHLLMPHFEGSVLINGAADSALVAPENGVDAIMMGTIGTSVRAVKAGVALYDFNEKMLPHQLESRGFSDDVTQKLLYSYRSDGTDVWNTLHTFVAGYVDHYYGSDADVVSDQELAAFVKKMGESGLKGVGEKGGGTVSTKSYLVDMVTHIIFTGSAQHAAVNFAQIDLMAYAPNQPLSCYGFKAEDVSEMDFLDCLPPLQVAQMQLSLGQMLGGLHYTELGKYPSKVLGLGHYFHPRAIQSLNNDMLKSFDELEAGIDMRIKAGIDNYHYLKPSAIPQSINI